MDFPLGWPVIPAANVRRVRALLGGAAPVVGVGEQVHPEQVVAERPGADGKREPVLAGLAGRVTQVTPGRAIVIEGLATIIQGVLGLGGVATGLLHFLPRAESVAVVPIPRGSVIVFPGQVPLTLLQRAATLGAAGVIAGSASARELEAFTRADLTAALDGMVPELGRLPLTLIFTEGVGSLMMDATIFHLLSQRAGDMALLDGATNPRRNQRPEVLLPLPLGTAAIATPADDTVQVGAGVRITDGHRRGSRGEVIFVFGRPQVVEPGILAPAVRVRLEDGSSPVVLASAVERVA